MDQTSKPSSPAPTPPTRDLYPERRQIASVALGLSAIFVFGALFTNTIHGIVTLLSPSLTYADWYTVVIQMLPMYLLAMPISLVLVFRLGRPQKPTRRRLSLPVLLGLAAICFSLTFVGSLAGDLINRWLSSLSGTPPQNELAEMTTATPFLVNLLFIGVLAPIMEELFYRKLVIDRLRCLGDLPAILLSGIAFGLIHGNFNQFFYATALGILFGAVYTLTGHIRYTVILHMAINVVSGVLTTEINRHGLVALGILYQCFAILSFVGAIVAVILFAKRIRLPLLRAEKPLSDREWLRVLLGNPAVWIFALVTLLLFL